PGPMWRYALWTLLAGLVAAQAALLAWPGLVPYGGDVYAILQFSYPAFFSALAFVVAFAYSRTSQARRDALFLFAVGFTVFQAMGAGFGQTVTDLDNGLAIVQLATTALSLGLSLGAVAWTIRAGRADPHVGARSY